MREARVLFPGQGDPLEKEMATRSSILAWKSPWMEEPGGLRSTGSQRGGHNRVTDTCTFFHSWFRHLVLNGGSIGLMRARQAVTLAWL